MQIARSFDVNKPKTNPKNLMGGIVGGSLMRGKLRVGDEIEIRPGIKGEREWMPITTKVESIMASGRFIEEARPGGLIGVATKLDPFLTKADNLVGNVLGHPNELPPVLSEFTMETNLFKNVVGLEESVSVEKIKTNEPLMLAVGTAITLGEVKSVRDGIVEVSLRRPVCAESKWRVAISRRVGGRWRLIGSGIIV
jgi:translation initiation factor 2 subunit 3